MELATKYNPSEVEGKWYQYWLDNKFFASKPDGREPYTIVIPPPNVTGVLHMGHMLNNTIQDILIRKARLDGKNACWVPGTDHASIATEAKVVNRLAEQGIKKLDLTREEFLKHAWDWTHEHGGIILKQLRRLGASCDWDRTSFTMDQVRSESVLRVFCDLYDKGLIYRGLRMVNWDPKAQTALSNIEVIYREEKSKLYHLKYYVADPENLEIPENTDNIIHKDERGYYAVVATTRPETIMGDTAMCINPKDPKNQWLKGHKVIVPLVGRVIPVIEDRYVDIEFGTGCLKVTPAHDVNDYNLGKTHNLETIDIFNPDGTISQAAGMYVGMDRTDVRRQIAVDLQEAGLMDHIEDYENKVGYSERNPDVAVEPRLCMQWYLSMKHFAEIALPPVLEGKIKFHPQKYVTTYRNWLENIDDWCISRQLWWGHRIPAYYIETKPLSDSPEGEEERFVVALTEEEAYKKALEKYPDLKALPSGSGEGGWTLRHDEDALDTWFSSWLWPISLFDGINNPGNEEIKYYYPTADLVTGPDIIFFWVARMIMAGEEYLGDVPFRNVYFTGIVRDSLGRKMSKQLGNSPDPIGLIDKYGADGVRMGMLLAAPAGNDILFDEALCEQGRNFCNKMWNAFRLIKGWESADIQQPSLNSHAIAWMQARIRTDVAEINDLYGKYRLNEALMAVFKLFTDEFSGWYLEMIKPEYDRDRNCPKPLDKATLDATLDIFGQLMQVIHPFMPFITEELYQHITERKEGESIMISTLKLDAPSELDAKLIAIYEEGKQVISGVRAVRQQKNISPREPLVLEAPQIADGVAVLLSDTVIKMAGLSEIKLVDRKSEGTQSFLVGTDEYAVPLGSLIDTDAEIRKAEAEIQRLQGFKTGIEKKLGNERFVQNAPAQVVELERKKLSDAESKIAALQETIKSLKG
ncbi:MAG: valine--tRNA ligase [Bacteroidaceae bacterium]|nr:valine--tRNA ligase [Bacteroidaceae bacterium]